MRTLNLIFGTCGLVACVGLVCCLPLFASLGAGHTCLAGAGLLGAISGLNGGHLLYVGITGSDRDQFTV